MKVTVLIVCAICYINCISVRIDERKAESECITFMEKGRKEETNKEKEVDL
jgi:hypothetical protein